jgi:hypothetical protein
MIPNTFWTGTVTTINGRKRPRDQALPSISICSISVNHTCVKDFRIDLGRWEISPLVITYIKVSSKEASMRILPIAAVLALLGSAAVAQTDAPKGYIGAYGPDNQNKAVGGPVPEVYLGPGLDIVASDGVSTKVVRAVPCSKAARETDGTTTCIGIPGPIGGGADSRESTTTGMSRR